MKKSKSAYSEPTKFGKREHHIIVVWVDNEAGVLARVVGLFSGRGYNIDSLAVAEVDKKKHLSRITIVTIGTPEVIEQIKLQLKKLIPVHKVADFSRHDPKILFKGFRIYVTGKLNGKMRRKTYSFKTGQLAMQQINTNLDYFKSTSFTKFGTLSIKV